MCDGLKAEIALIAKEVDTNVVCEEGECQGCDWQRAIRDKLLGLASWGDDEDCECQHAH